LISNTRPILKRRRNTSGDMIRVDEEGVKKGGQTGEGLITTLA